MSWGKRGQFTMFVIVGILLLFIFSLLLYVQGVLVKKQLQLQAQKQINDYIDQNSIRDYVQSCLDIITNDAVVKASLQGGVIDFSNLRNGIDYIRENNSYYNDSYNIPIVIRPNSDCNVVRNFPADYPFPNTPLVPPGILLNIYKNDPSSCYTKNIFEQTSGFFGLANLTRLCDWNGTNRINSTQTGFGFITCERPTYDNYYVNASVQQYMQDYIAGEIRKCVNFTYIQSRSAANITILNDPQAYVTFNKGGFHASVDYPFSINLGSSPIIRIVGFSIDKQVPFKELYDYAFYLIQDDVTQADFNIINDKAAPDLVQRGLYRDYIVTKIPDVDNSHTDIIQIIDNHTRIYGRPLIFQYAVQNRRPALDYISFTGSINGVDILVGENETITFGPQGYDPDEETVHYNYSLWKEDYDEVFNDADPKCTSLANSYFAYMLANCTTRVNAKPRNFTQSLLYLNNGMQNASYKTNVKDKGFHTVRISVWDRASLMDWQDVRVFIFDLPIARVSGKNMFPELSQNLASWEDIYTLDGSNSTIGLSAFIPPYNTFSKFLWQDPQFTKEKLITDVNSMKLFIPLDVNATVADMINLPSLVFYNNPPEFHNILLIVNTTFGISSSTSYGVDVKPCLPHRNNTNPEFPYNSDPNDLMNSLYADHTCCALTDSYAGSGTKCFNKENYGSNLGFYNYSHKPMTPLQGTAGYPMIYQNLPAAPQKSDNDIFLQNFTRSCTDNRGNICAGIIAEVRKDVEQCDDTNHNAYPSQFQDERCSGPPPNTLNNVWLNSSVNNVHCINYTNQQSFERKAGIPSKSGVADGSCSNGPQCGTPGIGFNLLTGTNGRYACNAYCDGKGGCTSMGGCVCNYNLCSSGGGSPLCNGLTGNGPPSSISCSAGLKWMADTCSNCGLVDSGDNICRSSGTDCSAIPVCDGHNPYYQLSQSTYCDGICHFGNCNNYAYNSGSNSCFANCVDDSQCNTAANHHCIAGACN